ncbi:MAG TPA: RES family NAD+ phosphorylase [Bacteroidia bacterium]|nr:RES family NAD+ phosphorylase [Bacteroidia bacterium]
MEVFRISGAKFAGLSGSGKAARWNKANQFVLYTGSSRSLSALELLVHKNSIQASLRFKVLSIQIRAKEELYKKLHIKDLPKDWRYMNAYPELQEIGSVWYEARESLVLGVPSVLIPQEYNYIINTQHPEFGKMVQIRHKEDFFWDERLMS